MSCGNPARPSVNNPTTCLRPRGPSCGAPPYGGADRWWGKYCRRAAAILGLFGLVSFPELPPSPKPPAHVPLSVYLWNTTPQSVEMAVAMDGTWVIRQTLAAGTAASRHDVIVLVEGAHRVEARVAGVRRTIPLTVEAQGNHWVVVSWWGKELEVSVQRQPPWVEEREGG